MILNPAAAGQYQTGSIKQFGVREAARRTAPPSKGRILVFHDRSGLAARLCGRGGALSEGVVSVEPGADFQRLSVDRYRLDPAARDHDMRLFESLAADGVVIERVLHVANYTLVGGSVGDPGTIRDAAREGVYSLLNLVGAMARLSPETRPAEIWSSLAGLRPRLRKTRFIPRTR